MLATWHSVGKIKYIKGSRIYIYGIKVGGD